MAGTFPSAHLPLSVTTGLGPDALLLVGITGREAMSELFRYELELLAEPGQKVPFEDVLGKQATVTVRGPGNTTRHISGYISRFSRDDDNDDYAHLSAELVPHFWLLTRAVRSRIFQQLSVIEVLRKVLQGLNVTWNLSRSYEPINYCVQYRESDFAFASRTMEAFGIYYYFQHESDKDVLVISDQTQGYPQLAEPSLLAYNRSQSSLEHPCVQSWSKSQSVGVSRYSVSDYHFEVSEHRLSSSAAPGESVAVGRVSHAMTAAGSSYEVTDYPGGYVSRHDGIGPHGEATSGLQPLFDEPQKTANLWMQREVGSCFDIRGQSTYANLKPGYLMRLEHHGESDGDYRLTKVTLDAKVSGFRSGESPLLSYRNRFQCLPESVAYRPPLRTPRPVISGPQTAVVTGIENNVPFVDKFGRVKVQFHWDTTGNKDSTSSCWIRVAQSWAGRGWGATFWPRPGHEVVVGFEHGDPDLPIIVGSVYNDHNMPPYPLPRDAFVGGIKSCSISPSANPDKQFSYLIFDDQDGHELVRLHSEGHIQVDGERGQWQVHPDTTYHRVGGLTSPGWAGGSGSGSGGGDENKHFVWDEMVGANVDFTIGFSGEMVIGALGFYALGANVEITLNPFGEYAIGKSIMSSPAAAVFSLLGGDVAINFSAQSEVLYGPFLEVHRGVAMTIGGELSLKPALLSAAFQAISIGALITAAILDPSKDASGLKEGLALALPTGLPTVMTAILLGVESAHAAQETGEILVDELKALEAHVETWPQSMTISEAALKAIEGAAQSQLATVGALLAQLKQSHQFPQFTGTFHPTLNEISDYPCLVGAQAYTIVASSDNAEDTSYIHINAQGKHGSGENGDLFITASRCIDIRLGTTQGLLAITGGKAKLVFNPSDQGGLVLGTKTSMMPDQPMENSIIIDNLGNIRILAQEAHFTHAKSFAVEAEEFEFTTTGAAGGATVSIKGKSLEATGFTSIKLSAGTASIELSGGGVKIGGTTLDASLTQAVAIKGLTAQIQAQGQASIQSNVPMGLN